MRSGAVSCGLHDRTHCRRGHPGRGHSGMRLCAQHAVCMSDASDESGVAFNAEHNSVRMRNGCNVFGMLTELRTCVDAVVPRGGGGPRRRARAVGRAVGHPHRDQTTNTPRIWHAWHHDDVRRAAPVSTCRTALTSGRWRISVSPFSRWLPPSPSSGACPSCRRRGCARTVQVRQSRAAGTRRLQGPTALGPSPSA